jgi:hypothetical protein
MSVNQWQQLADELANELNDLQQLRALILKGQSRLGSQEPDELEKFIPAGLLQNLYDAAERIMSHIAKKLDQHTPSGPNWHRELLEQMSQPFPATRPAVLQPQTAAILDDYRRFRHIVRNIYGFELEWARLQPLFDGADALLVQFISDIEQFRAFLSMMATDNPPIS